MLECMCCPVSLFTALGCCIFNMFLLCAFLMYRYQHTQAQTATVRNCHTKAVLPLQSDSAGVTDRDFVHDATAPLPSADRSLIAVSDVAARVPVAAVNKRAEARGVALAAFPAPAPKLWKGHTPPTADGWDGAADSNRRHPPEPRSHSFLSLASRVQAAAVLPVDAVERRLCGRAVVL
jgi:hypothetical protein